MHNTSTTLSSKTGVPEKLIIPLLRYMQLSLKKLTGGSVDEALFGSTC